MIYPFECYIVSVFDYKNERELHLSCDDRKCETCSVFIKHKQQHKKELKIFEDLREYDRN